MNCPTCGTEVLDKMRFCPECGENLEKIRAQMKPLCPECKTECNKGAKFCYNCGYKFGAATNTATVSTSGASAVNDSALDFGAVFSGFNIDELSSEADALGAAATKKKEKEEKESALAAFEYADQGNGTYAITGLKNKMMLNVDIPEGVVAIGAGAFEGAEAFSVNLPEGLMQIGNRAFKNCKNLSVINIPSTLVLLGDEAFYGCELLDIELPEGLRRVGRDALAGTASQRRAVLEGWTVGSEHTFGSYPQSSANSKEPIEWIVLKREDDKAFLLSKYVLDCKPFHEGKDEATWEKCTLRKWMNGEFYNAAFSAEEKEKIQTAEIKCAYYYGEEDKSFFTKDKIFPLSSEDNWDFINFDFENKEKTEINKNLRNRLDVFDVTEYAISRGARRDIEENFSFYWLRDLSVMDEEEPFGIEKVGTVVYDNTYGYEVEIWAYDIGVRPAMWIKL